MKKLFSTAVLIVAVAVAMQASAQGLFDIYRLNSSTHRQIIQFDPYGNALGIFDDGGQDSNYTVESSDLYLTISGRCDDPSKLSVVFSVIDIDPHDTLFVIDGMGTGGVVRAAINNNSGHRIGQHIFVSPLNTTDMLTIRFKRSSQSHGGAGFVMGVECSSPCEVPTPTIDRTFYRTRNGVVYDQRELTEVPRYDTIEVVSDRGDTTYRYDTTWTTCAFVCAGDGAIFLAHGEYTHDNGYYTPSDATSEFRWSFANSGMFVGQGLTQVSTAVYTRTGCEKITVDIVDSYGCLSREQSSIQVRTAENPIKTIFTLADICNRDSLMVNMGFDGDNATLTLRTPSANLVVSRTNEVRTFIPDGPNCAVRCYEAPVTFTEFPNKTIASGNDICSVCINMEHSYIGDLTVSIVCPSGRESFFFFGNQDPQKPSGYQGGGGKFMGFPLDAGNWDSSNRCDSLQNPFGKGLDYCFSRNVDYVLVTGDAASTVQGWPTQGAYDIVKGAYMLNTSDTIPVIPSYFLNQPGLNPGIMTLNHLMPSDHANRRDYYLPYSDYSELVGCPMNGTWSIRVCDHWGADNGWVFNWSMDLCGVTQNDNCDYQVGVDSLIWRPSQDPRYCDYELGHYRGLYVTQATPTVSYIMSPDTAGTFPIDVIVYDEFGCKWDTTTRITTYWTPEPNLGDDIALCGVASFLLDAKDRHAEKENYSYVWEPFGQNTDTISTATWQSGPVSYVAEVTNTRSVRCISRDTVVVNLKRQPVPNFDPDVLPLEGCSPMTVHFTNYTIDGDTYRWEFGDGVVSEEEHPTHTYATGEYELRYYVTSADGCVDSVYPYPIVSVFDAPRSAFSWEPTYPSLLNPVIHLHNETSPMLPQTKYFWEVQYNKTNTVSVQTLTDTNADWVFATGDDEDVAGNYTLRLIARTDNLAPSGNIVYCRDTAENSVLLVNDFLQFPNVVTPNGDGINDVFVIKNLVEGMGYPINTLDIYNKWGTRVFHRENIQSEADFWDPAGLPAGTYFFRFSARGYNGNIEHNGAVEVLVD